jgi:hypothetical protein
MEAQLRTGCGTLFRGGGATAHRVWNAVPQWRRICACGVECCATVEKPCVRHVEHCRTLRESPEKRGKAISYMPDLGDEAGQASVADETLMRRQ